MNDNEFIPDTLETEAHSDGKRIRLRFHRDIGDYREVVVLRSWLPQLLNQLRVEIAPNSAIQIDKNSLRPGQDFAVQGWECRRSPEGGARMVLYIDLPDQGRVVTVPVSFDQEDVNLMVASLTSQS